MGLRKTTLIILLIAFPFLIFFVSAAFSTTVDDVAKELTCTCGCNMLVSACEGTMECSAAASIKDQILAKLNAGMSREEIIAYFVSRHGEKILSAPTKRGFNLTAWVLPFVAILLGVGLLYVLLQSWASRRKPVHEEPSFREEDKSYLERIEKELKTFEG